MATDTTKARIMLVNLDGSGIMMNPLLVLNLWCFSIIEQHDDLIVPDPPHHLPPSAHDILAANTYNSKSSLQLKWTYARLYISRQT